MLLVYVLGCSFNGLVVVKYGFDYLFNWFVDILVYILYMWYVL